MIITEFLVNNKSQTPTNHKELSIDLTFDAAGESSGLALSTNEWRFDREQANEVLKAYNAGKIFEGLPFDIKITELENNKSILFDMYLDFTQQPTLTSDSAIMTAEMRQQLNWLTDVADSFSFQYLYEETSFINDSDFRSVPYVINSVPNYKDMLIALVSAFIITQQLLDATASFGEEVSRAFAVPATIGAVVVLALKAVRIVALLATLIKLVTEIVDLLIQPVKYHKGMYVNDLFEAACSYLELEYKTTILTGTFNNLFILPEKFNAQIDPEDENGRLLGFRSPQNSQRGYFDGTFGDLIRAMRTMFNAKIVIRDGVLWFVDKEYSFGDAKLTLPKLLPCDFELNSDEIKSNYIIKFKTDTSEKNTVQDYEGTIVKAQHRLIQETRKDLRVLKNVENQNIPFALGKRKEELTQPEKILSSFFEAMEGVVNRLIFGVNGGIIIVNTVKKFFNTIRKLLKLVGFNNIEEAPLIKPIENVNFGEIVNDRIGVLMLEFDNYNVPKIFLLVENSNPRLSKIKTDNRDLVNARYLWENYHITNSFAPYDGNPNGNQWIRYKLTNVPFCFDDFDKVKNNNTIFDEQGREAKVEKLEWNVWSQTANIEYRVNKKYTSNLKVTLHEPTGL